MDIRGNWLAVKKRIAAAEKRAGRPAGAASLVAVTKTFGAKEALAAYEAGQRDFGENRVQEWRSKAPLLPDDCRWHIIGRLQTNKVKYLDGSVRLIHSLDRFSLLQALAAAGEKKGLIWPALIEVNIANDEAKAGLPREDVRDFLISAADYAAVEIRGLMTVGAFAVPAAETRETFRCLRLLRDELRAERIPGAENLAELSMGMSQDFETAVEEGATIVRVGSLLFGARKQDDREEE
ncbi:MAG: YggS family pyridoxal phosphate-dependent enzyme [Gracilibacteraceae bacterium]|jgi:pyridoxal phosphate enzyme (YggS family)|nr:YggS family pyridoxal phosphate-dependent enzyme [Gracilibacteraceae bacterium]